MPAYDLPLEELRNYRPVRDEPLDFDAFWEETLEEVRPLSLEIRLEQVNFNISIIDTYDVTYSGWCGQPIKGWFLVPHGAHHPLPCVVEFPSYGGGRGFPLDWLVFPSAGYAYFVMDNRGQGSGWRQGETPDIFPAGSAPHSPGVMTLGIQDPHTYFYRRLLVDAVRACPAVRTLQAVNPSQIAVTGMSQGGAASLVVSALEPSVKAVMPEVTFLSNFRRATTLVDTPPYNEINNYCQIHRDKVEQVFNTLSYFDAMNFAARAQVPALFSVGLMDTIAPPSTVFASYNWYAGEKDIKVWPFNGHEGGGTFHQLEKLKFLERLWKK
jgi:cephalosporin-C deacetylase